MRLRLWALLAVVVPTLAAAQPLSILGPDGEVDPDGFAVAVEAPKASFEVTGARLAQQTSDGPFSIARLVPDEGAREVRVRARAGSASGEARFPVGPAVERVKLALEPKAPVKGRDQKATLSIELERADGSIDPGASPPVLRASTGEIENLRNVAPGRFEATYVLPKTRYPEVVVLVAFSAWPDAHSTRGTAASLLVPIASAIDLPGFTEPGAKMSIEIAGVNYGPTQAGADGRFKLPVVVPPGHRFGKGVAIDRVGNRRRAQVDLMLPPTDRLACVLTPARLPLGQAARARVLCATTDPYGAPMQAAHVELNAQRGRVEGPTPAGNGLFEWTYFAPEKPSLTPDVLSASWKQGGPLSRESFPVEFEQGPATEVKVEPAAPVVFRGGSVAVRTRVLGPLGWPRDQVVPALTVGDGTLSAPREIAPGVFESRYSPAPGGQSASVEIAAHAEGPLGREPHRIVAWREGDSLWAAVLDAAGLRVPEQPLVIDGRKISTDANGEVKLGPAADGEHRIAHQQWPALSLHLWRVGGSQFPAGEPPPRAASSVRVPIAPPVPVNVRVLARGREITYWAESADGVLLSGRALSVSVAGGSLEEAGSDDGRRHARLSSNGRATVVVRDEATGVTAVAEVGS